MCERSHAHAGDRATKAVHVPNNDSEGGPLTPAKASHYAEPETHQRKSRRSYKGPLIAVGVVAAIYVAVAAFFMFHFYPNTTLGGADVSLASISAEESRIADEVDGYSIAISGDGLDLDVSGSDIDLAFDGDGFRSDIGDQQNPWAWPAQILGSHTVDLSKNLGYDEDKLSSLLEDPVAACNETATPTTDATIAYDEESGAFKVVDEVYGTEIDLGNTVACVGSAIMELDDAVDLGEESLAQPTVSNDDEHLSAAVEEANSYLALKIPLNLNGTTAYTIDGTVIKDFVTLDDDLNVTIDQDALNAWVNDTLSPALNTVGGTRTYTRPDGKEVTVTGGDYGWSVDVSASATEIANAITSKDETAIELAVSQSAQAYNGAGQADWGDTYVDVDLTEQHARYYQDGELVWESDIVSGNTSEGRGTPEGVYDLNGKALNQTLLGDDEDGDNEPDYKTPVTYWMPFVGNSVGLHDAWWRSSFGGDIYTYNGSHGCVNLPSSKAKELYDLIEVGTVVVVHW